MVFLFNCQNEGGSTAFFSEAAEDDPKSDLFAPICTGFSLSKGRNAVARGEEVDQRGKKLESLFSLRYCE